MMDGPEAKWLDFFEPEILQIRRGLVSIGL